MDCMTDSVKRLAEIRTEMNALNASYKYAHDSFENFVNGQDPDITVEAACAHLRAAVEISEKLQKLNDEYSGSFQLLLRSCATPNLVR